MVNQRDLWMILDRRIGPTAIEDSDDLRFPAHLSNDVLDGFLQEHLVATWNDHRKVHYPFSPTITRYTGLSFSLVGMMDATLLLTNAPTQAAPRPRASACRRM